MGSKLLKPYAQVFETEWTSLSKQNPEKYRDELYRTDKAAKGSLRSPSSPKEDF
jgi:hypothetical protein